MPNRRYTDNAKARESRAVERLPEPEEVGRRIRAALVLAGKSAEEVAPELNVSARTLERVVAGKRQARDWELRRLAELLDVPEWFLREGLGGQPTESEIREGELAALRQLVEALDRKLDVAGLGQRLGLLEAEVRTLAMTIRETAQ
jgi:transcriptional regulator with XRE-family HTH domain